MSVLGSNLYCVPYGTPSIKEKARRRGQPRGRRNVRQDEAERLRNLVLRADPPRTAAQYAADFCYPSGSVGQDMILRMVLEDDALDVMSYRQKNKTAQKTTPVVLIIPAQDLGADDE